MTQETMLAQQGASSSETPKQQFILQHLYAKEQECDVPHAPGIYLLQPEQTSEANNKPVTSLEMKINHYPVRDDLFEVVLGFHITSKIGQQTAYQVKLAQAGLFQVTGYTDKERDVILNVHAPQLLFPYARHLVSNMTQAAGFSPLTLTPMNFEALYQQKQKQKTDSAAAIVTNDNEIKEGVLQ